MLSSASFADGASGACACRDVSGTAVSGDVAALAGMPLTYLCVSAAFSCPIRSCDGALTPSACVLTGRDIQGSYVFGDTAALSAAIQERAGRDERFSFTPCSDLGGCGSGALVASPPRTARCPPPSSRARRRCRSP